MAQTTTKALDCPRCDRELQALPNRRAVIDRCAGCNGTFFDQGEMIQLLGESADPTYWLRAATSRESGLSEIDCPRCTQPMALRTLVEDSRSVEIDHCGGCGGLWLDGGEVDALMQIGARQLARERAGGRTGGAPAERAEAPAAAEPDPAPKKSPSPEQARAAMAILNFMTSADEPRE